MCGASLCGVCACMGMGAHVCVQARGRASSSITLCPVPLRKALSLTLGLCFTARLSVSPTHVSAFLGAGVMGTCVSILDFYAGSGIQTPVLNACTASVFNHSAISLAKALACSRRSSQLRSLLSLQLHCRLSFFPCWLSFLPLSASQLSFQ